MAAKVDYLIKTNEDWLDAIELNDGQDPPEDIDLTDWSFRSQIRSSADSSIVFLDASTANGLHAIDGNALSWNVGKLIIAAQLFPGKYVYDTVGTDGDGHATRVAEGVITVELGVTRP